MIQRGVMVAATCAFALLSGCSRRARERPFDASASATPAEDARAPSPGPSPAAEIPAPPRTWDGCSAHDPNPWGWRSKDQGMWGEDPALVPDFGYEQERRAPKMPDADRYLGTLGSSAVGHIEDALLICEVEVYSRNGLATFYRYALGSPDPARPDCGGDWDPLGPPDLLLRLRLREDYPIALFGPEDHWGAFVSIPRVTLHAGDALAVKLWDRDSGTVWSAKGDSDDVEFMGEASLRWDGKLPISLHAPFFSLRCNAMKSEDALLRARKWIADLDKNLDRADAWRPEVDTWDFGANIDVGVATGNYFSGNFRYAAGFVGWDHPEIQRRLARMRKIAADEPRLRRELVLALEARAKPPSGTPRVGRDRAILRVTSAAACTTECIVEVEVGPKLQQAFCAPSVDTRVHLVWIDEAGRFTPVAIARLRDEVWSPCDETSPATEKNLLRVTVPAAARLLWLGGDGKALIFSLPR